MIRIKRVYDSAEPDDGARFFIERLWPRGVKKAELAMQAWLKEVAPGPVTRLYSARDVEHNSALALKAVLESHLPTTKEHKR